MRAAGTGTYGTTYLRIITYKRVILSYTPALLMIIKTPRSILFALEYFLKFSPDNGAIRVSPAPRHPRPALRHPLTSSRLLFHEVELRQLRIRSSKKRVLLIRPLPPPLPGE